MSEIDKALIQSSIYYLLLEREEEELKPFFTCFKQELTEQGEDIMSYGEKLIQQGMQQGHQEAQKEIAEQLLRSGVDSAIIAKATHLTPAQVEELKNLCTK